MGNYVAAANATGSLSEQNKPEESRLVTRYDVTASGSPILPATGSSIDEADLRLAIQSLDALISKVVAEKTIQYQQQQQAQNESSMNLALERENDQQNQITNNNKCTDSLGKQISSTVNGQLMAAFATSLANVLGQQQTQNQNQQNLSMANSSSSTQITSRRLSANSSSPLYRCPSKLEKSTCDAGAIVSSKINYKNLFPRPSLSSSEYQGLAGHQQQLQQSLESRRTSSAVFEGPMSNPGSGNSPLDTIRVNLPEVLDAQDEITLLRLLIKLLSGKVSKLSEERRQLLANVSLLSDINAEMATLIERGIQKGT